TPLTCRGTSSASTAGVESAVRLRCPRSRAAIVHAGDDVAESGMTRDARDEGVGLGRTTGLLGVARGGCQWNATAGIIPAPGPIHHRGRPVDTGIGEPVQVPEFVQCQLRDAVATVE